jgi:cell division protein FtsQ
VKQWTSTLSVLALLGMAAVGGRAGHRWLVTTARFGAKEVEVSGLRRTRREEVLTAARITPSRNVLSIDAEATARALERLPWVEHATVRRRLPGHVEITLEERTAVAILAAGGEYLVAPDGTPFKRVVQGSGDPTDLPVITGLRREAFEHDPESAREGLRDALALLADVAEASGGQRVEEVHRAPTGDLSLVLAGTYVWLGQGPYRAKLSRLRVVLGELRRRGLEASEVHLESDRHPERVTVRPRGA